MDYKPQSWAANPLTRLVDSGGALINIWGIKDYPNSINVLSGFVELSREEEKWNNDIDFNLLATAPLSNVKRRVRVKTEESEKTRGVRETMENDEAAE
ncbi:hypothetical protein PABG_11788 [Paracoccidioides brasiliensis Pb03]|nr:hypothetical protein PABG_11788 [Paracoccidioides brasiliensis Pb03]